MVDEAEQDIYFKQAKLFNPHQNEHMKVFVYGAGSIGSHVVMGLAKIGISNITVYDFDSVEAANIPAQFYGPDASGLKVYELAKLTKQLTGVDITPMNGKIDEGFQPDITYNTIHILAFDNIEARRIVFEKLKDYPVHLLDGRIGGFNWEKHYCRCDNQHDWKQYSKSLDGTFAELECGEKCLWPVNSMIASKIVADVVKLSKATATNVLLYEEEPARLSIGHMLGDTIIGK